MINLTETTKTGEGFRKYFEIVPALSDMQKDAAFHLRHSVYCEDLGWEPTRSDAKETDDFDAHSLHCLVRSVASGHFVGYVRLVLARPENLLHPLPFENTCAETLDSSIIDLASVSREHIAEVSRLAIVGQYRRRRGEERNPGTLQEDSFGNPEQPRFPYLLIGLYMAVFALAERHGLKTLFLLVEPRLARHLNHVGIHNVQIGRGAEHRGLRIPAMMDVSQIIQNLNPFLRSIFVIVSDEVETAYRAADLVVASLGTSTRA
jgi:N-acyl amino acid synthase of PEP-CTERM/exosortase system